MRVQCTGNAAPTMPHACAALSRILGATDAAPPCGGSHMRYPIRRSRGFTLVEILIVVIILGILAAIVIPQFTNASQQAMKSSTQSQLQTLRSQIQLYQ